MIKLQIGLTPDAGQLVELLKSTNGRPMSAYNIACRFKLKASQLSPLLNQMVREGSIKDCVPARTRCYFIPAQQVGDPAAPQHVYRPEFKPMTNELENARNIFRKGCEAIR